jgi:uncharacterized protein YndB with AHSA1/START domain
VVEARAGPGSVTLALTLPRPVGQVWAALTGPGHVAAWWGRHVSLEAVPGGRLVERWRDGETGREVVTAGSVARHGPPRLIEVTWADEGWPAETRVVVRLEPAEGGAAMRLALEHAGWDLFPGGEGPALRDRHAAGWAAHLRSLEAYLEGAPGDLTPPP